MNFTPNIRLGLAFSRILTIAAVGILGWAGDSAPAPTPSAIPQAAIQSGDSELLARANMEPAPAQAPAPRPVVRPKPVQPVSHNYRAPYHHSRRKSAAIIGGSAAGGALIGGLAGGGKGALVGGVLGGGGGYLYNRYRRHHHR
jgi:uncharacterized protein YcfJ